MPGREPLNRWFWSALTVMATGGALLGAHGCSGSSSPNTDPGASPTGETADSLADAPEEWEAFLRWAAERLETRPTGVPLPDAPAVARPQWPLVRLDDTTTLREAREVCDWTAPPRGAGVLAAVGPFRSDQPHPDCRVALAGNGTARGKNALRLAISGFDVQREEVGSIELTVRIPFGRHIVLKWSRAGTVLVPVESHDELFTVRVLTDGLAEWTGALRTISIITDSPRRGEIIEIRSLRFLPRTESYPAPIDVKRVRLGDELRTAVYAHCPAETTYEGIRPPSNAKLHVGIGAVSGTNPGAGAPATTIFEVLVASEGHEQTILRREITGEETWSDVSASLAAWSGKPVDLTLKCASTTPATVAFWANPIIYQPVDDPPVVVLYLIDTVAAEHVNLYGYERETMPRLAALAARGVWFSQMVSNSSRTIESIPDLMLSLPTERVEVYHSSTAAPQGLVTIAEALRAGGFATVSFCTNVNAGPRQGMDQGFDTFVDKISYFWNADADRTIPLEQVMAWIAGHRDRPMFLYIHTAEPHAPYTPPPGYAARFDADYRGPHDGTFDAATSFRLIRDPVGQRRDVEHVGALYDEEILYSDARLGLFLDALEEERLLDRTYFFVTSDHGEEFLQHGDWEHGYNLHNEQTRVPLVACGPTFRSGVRVDAPVQIFDIMPTILAVFDLPAPHALHGRSLLPLLREPLASGGDAQQAQEAETLRQALRGRNVYASNHNYRMLRKLIEYSVLAGGRWKLLFGARALPMYPGGPHSRFLLFDLQTDPFERRNLIRDRQDVARRLIEELVRWRVRQPPYDVGVHAPTPIDAQHMRELQALGYVAGSDEVDAEPNDTDSAPQTNRP